jgi:RNA-directed DNA polymerase
VRAEEKSAEAVVAMKSGNAEGAKGRRTKEMELERDLEQLDNAVSRTFRQKAMYENLMEEAVAPENYRNALGAVTRNDGAPGIDRMPAAELEKHLETHGEKSRAKLLAGTYVPTPVRRVEIPKPSGGVRMLGIPTVMDRFIQQLLLQVLSSIFEPLFRDHSYGFRPGKSAADAMRAAREFTRTGKDWVVDIDITKFLDTASYCPLVHESCSNNAGC